VRLKAMPLDEQPELLNKISKGRQVAMKKQDLQGT
jgi:hypothetical protein